MFYSGLLADSGGGGGGRRGEPELRQQRRMKQAVQFIHKDSADLLPLDGLKKLGTSKDTQPHNILQRRLLDTNLSKIRNNRPSWIPKSETQSNKVHHGKPEPPRKSEEEEALYVWCQCAGKEMRVKIDTSCQHNIMSSACLDRLGLKERFRSYRNEEERVSLPYNVRTLGQVDHVTVAWSSVSLDCSAVVIDDKERSFSLGLQTLRSLKCVINLEKNHLEVGRAEREVVPFMANRNAAREGHSSDA